MAQQIGVDIPIHVVFTTDGVETLALAPGPALGTFYGPDGNSFVPTNAAVTALTGRYQYTLAAADTTAHGAGLYQLVFTCADPDIDDATVYCTLDVGAAWIERLDADISAVETDTQNIQSRIPAALVAGNMVADAVAISGSANAATRLEVSAETMVIGAAVAGTLSDTQMTTNLTEATNDHYNGRVIIWTTGALTAQATDITAYDGATKRLTYTGVTEAPGVGDAFIIV